MVCLFGCFVNFPINQNIENLQSTQTNIPLIKFGLQDFTNSQTLKAVSTTDSIHGSTTSNQSNSSHSINKGFSSDPNYGPSIAIGSDNIIEWNVPIPSSSNTTYQTHIQQCATMSSPQHRPDTWELMPNFQNKEEDEFSSDALKQENTHSEPLLENFYQDAVKHNLLAKSKQQFLETP
jgi:hypothetical protein